MTNENKVIKITKEYEEQLIGCILLSPEILDDLQDISEDDFLDVNYSTIFSTIVKLTNEGTPVDIVTVSATVGLHKTIADCVASITSPQNYQHYADKVKELSTLRKLHDIAFNVSVKSNNAECRPDELVEYINTNLSELYTNKTKETVSAEEAVTGVMELVKVRMANPTDVTGITTGFPSMDKLLNGLHKTDLVILAARPARGKSALALQLAKNVSLYAKVPTLFFSLEMATEQLVQRLVASESKVGVTALSTGKISDIEEIALEIASKTIGFLPLFFNDKTGLKIKDIKRQIKAYNHKNKEPLGLIIIDYLQLMAIGSGRDNMVQVVTEISRGLKMVAKEFNVCVLALSQLSRDVEKRGGRPKLSDLRDSGSIEQDADVVMFLHSKDKEVDSYGNKEIELLIEKHRSGPTGSCFFTFKGGNMTFTESQDSSKWLD